MSQKTETTQKKTPKLPKLTGILSRSATGTVSGHKSIRELMEANREAIENR